MKKYFAKHKSPYEVQPSGVFIAVNPNTGWIESIFICARDDQEQKICEGALARLSKPTAWSWLRRLIGRNRVQNG